MSNVVYSTAPTALTGDERLVTILTVFKSGCTMVDLEETYVNILDNSTDLNSVLDLFTAVDGPELYIGLAVCCVGLVLDTFASYAIIKT